MAHVCQKHKILLLTIPSIEEFEYYKNLEPRGDIEKAIKTFILIRQSFNAEKIVGVMV
mgnify:CR=1 FL=1